MGAWIETVWILAHYDFNESLPMWERGLKLGLVVAIGVWTVSLPMWERGLKRVQSYYYVCQIKVAPHVGAWIETHYA